MSGNSKQQIIVAAGITFERYGFKKTTMDDIAYAAGKGKSSLYYYFKNKEEVFEAVVAYEAENLVNEINTAISGSSSAVEKLKSYMSVRMKRFVKRGNLATALNDNFLATFSFIEKIRDNYRGFEIELIAGIINEGIEKKEFKAVNAAFTAELILTGMIGFEVPLLTKSTTFEESVAKINSGIEMFFYGICT
ncbi:TetR/AcrR family transcriptional regulator [Draconibacterium sp. IB214405]|uniref:TetR/AcrR family transcriptional regulator n=1 Tax=Draconibacterium sp. IB214405 TaxID=3097352 RepID=UPI002A0B0B75|nr:TetR/AcrR family transcriptional regulator [Draconibacterium sp. IB214405]MDX8339580.1 TetR/AcrR family transcriptional regulator [Draconibacterium sp. IB214405]